MSEPWHRAAVGGLWEEIGQLQFDFLVAEGLRPSHYLLDVGCGSLRGGVHFISYLEAGRYYGVDKDEQLLNAGRDVELTPKLLSEKHPQLVIMDDFALPSLGRKFDYMIAQSVFTHLPLNTIFLCLSNVARALTPRGHFYATFFENPLGIGHLDPVRQVPGDFDSYCDRDPFHYDFDVFRWAAQQLNLTAIYIGDWDHPRNQKMMLVQPASRGETG